MNVNIDFSPRISEQLVAAANRKGVDPTTFVERLVTANLPLAESSIESLHFSPPGRAAERMRTRLVTEATNDPEVIRKAQESLDEMKRSMNSERLRSGAEPIF